MAKQQNVRMKRYKIIFVVLISIAGIVLYSNFKWTPQKWGINVFSAYKEVIAGKAIIVHKDDLGYYYRNGLFTRDYLRLIGKSPEHQFPSDTLEYNVFLLKGNFREELRKYCNRTVYEVDDWDIIVPINRRYHLAYQNGRLMRPLLFIDEFDVQNGDFKIVNDDKHTISNLEAEYLNDIDIEQYHIVTYENNNGNVIWYLVKNYGKRNIMVEKRPVELIGDSLPQQILKIDIFVNGQVPFKYINYFLIKGKHQEERLLVNDWSIIVPFETRSNNVQNYYLDDYFQLGIMFRQKTDKAV